MPCSTVKAAYRKFIFCNLKMLIVSETFVVVNNFNLSIKNFSVINRCVPSFVIDVLEKGKDMATAVADADVNATDASGGSYGDSIIGDSLG